MNTKMKMVGAFLNVREDEDTKKWALCIANMAITQEVFDSADEAIVFAKTNSLDLVANICSVMIYIIENAKKQSEEVLLNNNEDES